MYNIRQQHYLPPYFTQLGDYNRCGRLAKMDKPVCPTPPVPYSTKPNCGVYCDYREYPLLNLQHRRLRPRFQRMGSAYNMK